LLRFRLRKQCGEKQKGRQPFFHAFTSFLLTSLSLRDRPARRRLAGRHPQAAFLDEFPKERIILGQLALSLLIYLQTCFFSIQARGKTGFGSLFSTLFKKPRHIRMVEDHKRRKNSRKNDAHHKAPDSRLAGKRLLQQGGFPKNVAPRILGKARVLRHIYEAASLRKKRQAPNFSINVYR
jgi:hypothetical protein